MNTKEKVPTLNSLKVYYTEIIDFLRINDCAFGGISSQANSKNTKRKMTIIKTGLLGNDETKNVKLFTSISPELKNDERLYLTFTSNSICLENGKGVSIGFIDDVFEKDRKEILSVVEKEYKKRLMSIEDVKEILIKQSKEYLLDRDEFKYMILTEKSSNDKKYLNLNGILKLMSYVSGIDIPVRNFKLSKNSIGNIIPKIYFGSNIMSLEIVVVEEELRYSTLYYGMGSRGGNYSKSQYGWWVDWNYSVSEKYYTIIKNVFTSNGNPFKRDDQIRYLKKDKMNQCFKDLNNHKLMIFKKLK